MKSSPTVEIECKILHETDGALKITTDGHDEVWIPRYATLTITYPPASAPPGALVTLEVWEDVAQEKGLI